MPCIQLLSKLPSPEITSWPTQTFSGVTLFARNPALLWPYATCCDFSLHLLSVFFGKWKRGSLLKTCRHCHQSYGPMVLLNLHGCCSAWVHHTYIQTHKRYILTVTLSPQAHSIIRGRVLLPSYQSTQGMEVALNPLFVYRVQSKLTLNLATSGTPARGLFATYRGKKDIYLLHFQGW